ncbi:maltase-glucoamylase, intestinal-like, partial [Cebus imitator]|uniref:maltase-glucoamylase, intestinal-like n=1 Tax=Cebus imitator TaxID=2715852 RepID=UPI0018995703
RACVAYVTSTEELSRQGKGLFLGHLPGIEGTKKLACAVSNVLYRAYVAFPDFFRNSTAKWWKREIEELYNNPQNPERSLKFDGIWIDMNEPSSFVNGAVHPGCRDASLNHPPYMPHLESRDRGLSSKTLCMESEQMLPDGSPVQHYNVHSLYGWSQTRPTYEAMQEVTGQRGVVITRSTFPSSGRWAGHWLGDNTAAWDQLKKSIIGMMEFSLFGISYTGADICGFFQDAEYEMCVRWMQLGAFYPFSRNHNTIGTRRQDPVSWDAAFVNISRNVLQTRYTLLPYLYTLMHKAHMEGVTVVRPLLHEFVSDQVTWDIDSQFLLGPAFLVSPVLELNARNVTAYFPRARWYDYYTGVDINARGEWKTLPAPLDHINLHVRGGYILPWQEPALNTHLSRKKPLGLIIALDENKEAKGELFWDDGQTKDTVYRTTGGVLDFYVFLGPTPELVTQQYTELIGRPVMVPYWSLGFQLCRYGYQNDSEIASLYDEMVAAQIPYDVQYSDIDYMERQLDFTLSPKFAGFPALINRMKADGMRVILILDPAISGNETQPYPAFTRGMEDDVFIRYPNDGDIVWGKVWPDFPDVVVNGSLDWDSQVELYRAFVAFPDFFRNSTAKWWKREIEELYSNPQNPERSLKFDGIWIDMNEPSSFVNGAVHPGCRDASLNHPPYMPHLESRDRGLSSKTLCMESEQMLPDGSPVQHYNVHSLYGWSQTRPTYEAMQEVTGQRGVVITRSTFPSSGRWAGHWLGDNTAAWDQLKKSIIGMMEFSLFGISYTGADICGFFQDAEYEMCVRWMQLGAFYPFSRNHNTIGTRRQDPVSWDAAFVNISRNVLQTRYTLLPYLYTLMHKAHTEGVTVVRPLLHEFVSDQVTWDIDSQFLLGPAFLVSPVLELNARNVTAYFPRARWYDYYTGVDINARGEWKTLPAPLDHINLHVRGGYILPWQEPALNTHLSRQKFMGFKIALDDEGTAEGWLFWDDGQSIDTYGKGLYYLAKFSASQNTIQSHIIFNSYITSTNPLKLGYIEIWGVGNVPITSVSMSVSGMVITPSFNSDRTTQVLSIDVTDRNISLHNFTSLTWRSTP